MQKFRSDDETDEKSKLKNALIISYSKEEYSNFTCIKTKANYIWYSEKWKRAFSEGVRNPWWREYNEQQRKRRVLGRWGRYDHVGIRGRFELQSVEI